MKLTQNLLIKLIEEAMEHGGLNCNEVHPEHTHNEWEEHKKEEEEKTKAMAKISIKPTTKLPGTQLEQLVKEAMGISEETDDYDYDNPPPAEMIADALQDGLKNLVPAYDMDQSVEEAVHERVMEFAEELYELMGNPEIGVDPERYHDDPGNHPEALEET
jgi:hypothetical protein